MSTATKHGRAFTGLSISEVTKITGLERADIYRARELEQLGIPGDFSYPEGQEFYTVQGLGKLAEALPKIGKDAAAKLLRAALQQSRDPEPVPARNFFGWMDRHERQQEDAA